MSQSREVLNNSDSRPYEESTTVESRVKERLESRGRRISWRGALGITMTCNRVYKNKDCERFQRERFYPSIARIIRVP